MAVSATSAAAEPQLESWRRSETSTTASIRYVYEFDQGSREMRDLLGGKGANLAEMTRLLGADRVPAGFTITTKACVAYLGSGGEMPEGLDAQVDEALAWLERSAGRGLGDPGDPLLVSVRSGGEGPRCPGMLDSILNLGLNDRSVEGLAARTGNERFARDSHRRLVQMFGNVVRGHPRGALRGRDRRERRARPGWSWTPSSTPGGLHALKDRFERDLSPRRPARISPRIRGRSSADGDPRRVRLLEGRARGRVPAARTGSQTVGGPPSTCSRWSLATGADLGLGRRFQPRRDHRCAGALRRLPRSTPRGRTWSRVCATPRPSTRWPELVPAPTTT